MRITLPGGVAVDWTPTEIAEALHSLADALPAAIAEASKPPPSGQFSFLSAVELVDGEGFRFRGGFYDLTPGQFDLLEQLITAAGSVDLATLGERVWGDDGIQHDTIKKAAARLRLRLREHELPFSVRLTRRHLKLVPVCP